MSDHSEHLRQLRERHEGSSKLDVEQLEALATRLIDHADGIVEWRAVHQLEQDIRTARHVASDMATMRFHLKEIAASCTDEKTAQLLRALAGDL